MISRPGRCEGASIHLREKLLLSIAILAAFAPKLVDTAELWVDRNSLGGSCSDSRTRNEITKSTPWCTLSALRDILLPGDVVRVREGIYTEVSNGCGLCWGKAVLQVVVSGTAQQPIKIMAQPGESVVLSGDGGAEYGILIHGETIPPRHIVIDGFEVTGQSEACVLVWKTSDVVVRNLDVWNCSDQGMEFHYTNRVTIEYCDIHDNHLGGWTSAINLKFCKDENIVRGNRIWANTDEDPNETEGHGIIMDTCLAEGGALIESNVIWDNEGYCINIYDSDGGTLRNNTCWKNGAGRFQTGEVAIVGNDAAVHNNILVSRDGAPALLFREYVPPSVDFSTITSDYNIVWSPDHDQVMWWPQWNQGTLADHQAGNPHGWDEHSLQINPEFHDPAGGRFVLTRNSPALDSGTDLFSSVVDANGFVRPLDSDGNGLAQVDRGAFEYAGIFREDFEGGGSLGWSLIVP